MCKVKFAVNRIIAYLVLHFLALFEPSPCDLTGAPTAVAGDDIYVNI